MTGRGSATSLPLLALVLHAYLNLVVALQPRTLVQGTVSAFPSCPSRAACRLAGARPQQSLTSRSGLAPSSGPSVLMRMDGGGPGKGEAEGPVLSTLARKMAWELVGKNTKWIVSLSAAGVLLYRRDALAVSAIVGALSNAVIGKILKRILRQKRPDGAPLADPGMPSSHAMSLYFLSCYLCASIVAWTPAWAPFQKAVAMFALLAFSTSSAVWRVSSGLHTGSQIMVGALLGGTNGVLWFRFTTARMEVIHAMDAAMSANASIPAILCAVLIAGALIVGSIERKVGSFMGKK